MMQRLHCNVFMLSYRGYAISYFYYICTIQTWALNTLWVQTFLFSSFVIHLNLNFFIGMVRVMVILLRKGSHMMHRSVGSFMFYFTDFACSQFLQISCLLGCTWSSSSEEGHWHNQDSYLWKIFRRCCWSSSCQKQSWQGSHFYPICYSYCCRKLRNRLLYSLCYWMDGIPISIQNFILVPV